MLQRLARLALELCRADAAGISLLDGDVFRWEALAGTMATYRDGTMPRDASPCGLVIERNAAQLMRLPHRAFPALTVTPVIVEALLVPFCLDGKPAGTVWVVAQSEDRQFDQEDERVVHTLAHFAAAGWHLWRMAITAEESSRRKDQFLATLAHELRNPLAAMVAAVATLRHMSNDSDTERPVVVLERQTRHMSRLVDDMLDLARIGAGKLNLTVERVDLCRVIREAADVFRARFDAREQELSLDCSAEPIWIDADAERIAQIVFNLLDNAQKFTPERGRVSVTVTSEDRHASLEVCDSGDGIPKDKLEAIFDHFSQLDAHAPRSRGLGIGLALARRLASASGGTLVARSDGEGRGSCFVLRLPLHGGTLRSPAEH
jgi:signal transduction histidine kinase